MYLLDTNVISEMRKLRTGRIDANVEAWSRSVRESELHISVITIYELQLGLLSIERRDHRQADILRTWIEEVVRAGFATRTLAVTAEIAAMSAKLCIPDRRPLIDALIAATALVHGMTVATRNVADFTGTGVALLNPWHGGV